MNGKRILGIGVVLLVLAVFTAPAAADVEFYFEPDPSSVPVGEIATVQLMAHVPSDDGIRSLQVGVDFDPSVVNITNVTNPIKVPGSGPYPPIYWWDDVHQWVRDPYGLPGPSGAWVWFIAANDDCYNGPITVPIANFTIEGVGPGTSPLQITHEQRKEGWPAGTSMIFNCTGMELGAVWNDSTIAVQVVSDVEFYFEPDPSSVPVGEIATVQLMAHVPSEDNGIRSLQVGVDFDPSVVNTTNVTNPIKVPGSGPYPPIYWWDDVHQWVRDPYGLPGPSGAWVWFIAANDDCYNGPITVPIANFTIEGVGPGTSPLQITHEQRKEGWPAGPSMIFNCTGMELSAAWNDGTIAVPVAFEKELVSGWNLISLPLTPEDNSTSAVLSSMSGKYNAVFRYDADATAKQFECPSTMDPGIGYFVNVTTAGTWNYTGIAYTSMNVDLKQGLNCIGWVNANADLPDAMFSISGNYRYVAGWAADDSKYEVYDANAPAGVPEFIDFVTMGRGNGYWIAAKEDCTLIV